MWSGERWDGKKDPGKERSVLKPSVSALRARYEDRLREERRKKEPEK